MITKTVQHRMENFLQQQMRLHKLTLPGWGDPANYFCSRDMRHGTAELKVRAVVKPRIDTTTATPYRKTVGEDMQTPGIIPGQSEIPAGFSRPG